MGTHVGRSARTGVPPLPGGRSESHQGGGMRYGTTTDSPSRKHPVEEMNHELMRHDSTHV